MRIIFWRRKFDGSISGADEALTNYAAFLCRIGWSPSVLLSEYTPSDDYYRMRLEAMGVKITCIERHPVCYFLRLARKASQYLPLLGRRLPIAAWSWLDLLKWTYAIYLKIHRPALIHTMVASRMQEPVIRGSALAGIPVIYNERGTPYYAPELDDEYDALARVLPLCSALAAISPRLAELCRERYSFDGKVLVIPSIGVDLDKHRTVGTSDRSGVTFGFAGRLEEWKGPHLLLAAFGKVISKCPEVRLRLAGTGPMEAELVSLAKQLEIEEFCDFCEPYLDVPGKVSFIQSIDVLVHPSFAEGVPNIVYEAMSLSLPVIATDVGGIPDLLTSDCGIMVPPRDVYCLTDAMISLAQSESLRTQLGNAARMRFEELFDPECVGRVLVDAYCQVIGHKRELLSNLPLSGLPHPWISR